MKALVYTGIETLELRDVPDPSPAKDECLVRVESVGICGSDMHAFLGHDDRRPAPIILGHEVAGVVESGQHTRARVTVNPLVTCGACRYCVAGQDNLCPQRQIISMQPREGGFAQKITIPERNLVVLDDSLDFGQAALAEPIACGWHAARVAKQHTSGRTATSALVFGGGAIGMGAALSLLAQGISTVRLVEPNARRRAYISEKHGLHVIDPSDVASGDDYDVVIDGVGYVATREQASEAVRAGGIIVHIGLGQDLGGLNIRRMTLQEITFTGTYTYTAQDFRDTAHAMMSGKLGDLSWTEARPLSDGAKAFRDIRAGANQAPKIILKPTH